MTVSAYTEHLATVCAPGLATLVHPGNGDDIPAFPLALPYFQGNTLPDGMAQADAEELGLPTSDVNKHFLEAVIHLLEMAGAVVRPAAEYADLQAAAAAQEGRRHRIVELFCHCNTSLARVSVNDFDTDHPRVNGPEFIAAMHTKSTDCGTGHKA